MVNIFMVIQVFTLNSTLMTNIMMMMMMMTIMVMMIDYQRLLWLQ